MITVITALHDGQILLLLNFVCCNIISRDYISIAHFEGPLLHGRPLLTGDLPVLQFVIDKVPFVVQTCLLENGNT